MPKDNYSSSTDNNLDPDETTNLSEEELARDPDTQQADTSQDFEDTDTV